MNGYQPTSLGRLNATESLYKRTQMTEESHEAGNPAISALARLAAPAATSLVAKNMSNVPRWLIDLMLLFDDEILDALETGADRVKRLFGESRGLSSLSKALKGKGGSTIFNGPPSIFSLAEELGAAGFEEKDVSSFVHGALALSGVKMLMGINKAEVSLYFRTLGVSEDAAENFAKEVMEIPVTGWDSKATFQRYLQSKNLSTEDVALALEESIPSWQDAGIIMRIIRMVEIGKKVRRDQASMAALVNVSTGDVNEMGAPKLAKQERPVKQQGGNMWAMLTGKPVSEDLMAETMTSSIIAVMREKALATGDIHPDDLAEMSEPLYPSSPMVDAIYGTMGDPEMGGFLDGLKSLGSKIVGGAGKVLGGAAKLGGRLLGIPGGVTDAVVDGVGNLLSGGGSSGKDSEPAASAEPVSSPAAVAAPQQVAVPSSGVISGAQAQDNPVVVTEAPGTTTPNALIPMSMGGDPGRNADQMLDALIGDICSKAEMKHVSDFLDWFQSAGYSKDDLVSMIYSQGDPRDLDETGDWADALRDSALSVIGMKTKSDQDEAANARERRTATREGDRAASTATRKLGTGLLGKVANYISSDSGRETISQGLSALSNAITAPEGSRLEAAAQGILSAPTGKLPLSSLRSPNLSGLPMVGPVNRPEVQTPHGPMTQPISLQDAEKLLYREKNTTIPATQVSYLLINPADIRG